MTTRIGVIGFGKLGCPVSVAISNYFPVYAYDKNPQLTKTVLSGPIPLYPHRETGPDGVESFQPYYEKALRLGAEKHPDSGIRFSDTIEELVNNTDIIFVAVQTPHRPAYDGSSRLPADRKDFDYSHLFDACFEVSRWVKKHHTVAIISTVLPGTIRRDILPFFKGKCNLCYTPQFIAMGTVMRDYINPEFVLIGADAKTESWELSNFYHYVYRNRCLYSPSYDEDWKGDVPACIMSLESAELTKVAYNLNISAKIGMANTLGEIAHKIPNCNVDDVTNALGLATNRLISTKYMSAGAGDGGACLEGSVEIMHPNWNTSTLATVSMFSDLRVMAYDLNSYNDPMVEANGTHCRMTGSNKDLLKIVFTNGKSVKCTPDHLFLMSNGYYQEAQYFIKGTELRSFGEKDRLAVSSIEPCGSGDVYNLEVEKYHNYALACGVISHNCHPRDAIAMSWMAAKLKLVFNPFDLLMKGREAHCEWLVNLLMEHSGRHPFGGVKNGVSTLPMVILGKAFKEGTNIIAGSPALLVANILKERDASFQHYDPYVDNKDSREVLQQPSVYLVITKHPDFAKYEFPRGSVVLDVWRYIPEREGVQVVKIGVGS